MNLTSELLQKYLRGDCTPEEQLLVEKWLSEKSLEEELPEAPLEAESEQLILAQLKGEMDFSVEVRHFSSIKWWMVGVAACLLIGLGVNFLFVGTSPFSKRHFLSVAPVKSYKIISCPVGQKMTKQLPDGTIVHLNAGSELRYPQHFKGAIRSVTFSGEAYFEVAKDSLHPFVITTLHTRTTVLGTAFNLRALPSEKKTEVVVREGKVRFSLRSNPKAQVLLTASEKGTYVPGKRLREQVVYVGKYTAWMENKLIFDDQKLEDIVPILERWYGVKIELKSKELNELRYVGQFQNVSLPSLLRSMSYALDFQFQQKGNTYFIY